MFSRGQEEQDETMKRTWKNTIVPIVITVTLAALALIGAVLLTGQPAAEQTASSGGGVVVQILRPSDYMNTISPATHTLIDVRTPAEFAGGHIAGAINIAVDDLAARLDSVPRDRPVVVYCRSGNRSATAARVLANAGFDPIYDLGGIIAWQAAGLPLTR